MLCPLQRRIAVSIYQPVISVPLRCHKAHGILFRLGPWQATGDGTRDCMPICEGCGARVDDAHILRRKQRIDLAMRFRPIEIKTLLLNSAPSALDADYFYRVASDRAVRSVAARIYFEEMLKCMGPKTSQIDEMRCLADFRDRGFFLIHAVDCPI